MHRPDSKAPRSWTRVAVGLALAISTVSAGACGDDKVHHDNTVVSVTSQITTTTLAPESTTPLSPTGTTTYIAPPPTSGPTPTTTSFVGTPTTTAPTTQVSPPSTTTPQPGIGPVPATSG